MMELTPVVRRAGWMMLPLLERIHYLICSLRRMILRAWILLTVNYIPMSLSVPPMTSLTNGFLGGKTGITVVIQTTTTWSSRSNGVPVVSPSCKPAKLSNRSRLTPITRRCCSRSMTTSPVAARPTSITMYRLTMAPTGWKSPPGTLLRNTLWTKRGI